MKKFWNWKVKAATETAPEERTLFLNGTIAEDSWYDDDVTPALFKDELMGGSGNITVWINSPGGDCVAAAQIYNMLMDYPHDVTVKIDGIAASAASVIAMAGTKVLMSPVSTMMIHNPATVAWGDAGEMEKAIAMLESVKDSIINAYEIKSILSRAQVEDEAPPAGSMLYSPAAVVNSLMGKIAAKCQITKPTPAPTPTGRSIDTLMERLDLLKF